MLLRALALSIVALALAAPAALARDHGADGKWSKRRSSHFELYQDVALARYSGPNGSRAFEVAVLDVLESAHDRVRDRIGVEPRNGRVLVFVYDPGIFDASFGGRFGFRPAGFWDGAIQVRGGTQVDARLVSTLWHEYTHAALASLAPSGTFPAWLNEGLAELFEREALGRSGGPTADEIVALRAAAGGGQWLPLAELSGPTFAGLDETTARLAYLESYAVVEQMTYRYGPERVERFVEEIAKTRSVALALKRALRIDLAELEAQLWSRQP
jgi:hypothetical protein